MQQLKKEFIINFLNQGNIITRRKGREVETYTLENNIVFQECSFAGGWYEFKKISLDELKDLTFKEAKFQQHLQYPEKYILILSLD